MLTPTAICMKRLDLTDGFEPATRQSTAVLGALIFIRSC